MSSPASHYVGDDYLPDVLDPGYYIDLGYDSDAVDSDTQCLSDIEFVYQDHTKEHLWSWNVCQNNNITLDY